jgi:ribosome-associated toxin RatA of RatAB toxin-antitoxin module
VSEHEAVRVVRRSPGRLRLHAPSLSASGDAAVERIAAVGGVRDVRLSRRTGNVVIEFDRALIDEPDVLALIADDLEGAPRRSNRGGASGGAQASAETGWLRAERSETIDARPAACIAALTEFERYPEWQTYVTEVKVRAQDRRRRGVRVWTRAMIGEREIEFTTSYHFPSPNRILFAQDDGKLEAARGSWGFRSAGGERTRATCTLEVKPGWRLSLLLRGPVYERIREAVLDHLMDELRARVEGGRASRA